jgi:hypothetical protein
MKSAFILAVTSLATLHLSAAQVDWSKLPPAAKTEGVTFAKDIQPLFKASCVGCHGAERPKAQLRLDTLEGVLKGTKQGSILKTGDSANSLLVKAVSQLDPETAMPPKPRNRRNQGGPGGGFDHAASTNAPALQPREVTTVTTARVNVRRADRREPTRWDNARAILVRPPSR